MFSIFFRKFHNNKKQNKFYFNRYNVNSLSFRCLFNLVAPRFQVPPKDVYVLEGQTAVLECNPESSPPATITWQRNGTNLPGTGNQYSVGDVRAEDEGEYICKARNNRGSTQGEVQLSIGSK